MNDQEIFARVKRAIEDTLALEPDRAARVVASTNLIEDLGAESLDFLDLLFRLEDEFGIVLPQREFTDADRLGLSENDLASRDGTLTPAAIERLRTLLPEADPRKLAPGLKRNEIARCLTVQSFVNLVRRKLEQGKMEGKPTR
ncbi:MAG TPA: phosphopantetheine-binding protein [Planctomycetota bacterium]|nr:phosphopantetheine-binding protein [Planctomycetota bacterium]